MKTKYEEWEEICNEFEAMEKMNCKPGFKKLPKDYITDEDMSVKWNREQVEKNNEKHEQEVKRLNTMKNKERDRVYDNIFSYIQKYVGWDLDFDSAKKIWNYAYEQGHAFGMREIGIYLDEIMELVSDILENTHRK